MSDSIPLLEIDKPDGYAPFEVHSLEWIAQNRGQLNEQPHRHNYFVLLWLKEGAGFHQIDLERFPLEPDTVYCILPGQVHQMQAQGPIRGFAISFTREFMGIAETNTELLFGSGLLNRFMPSPRIRVSPAIRQDMEEVVLKLMKEYENFFLLRAEILRGYLRIFLIYLTRQQETETLPAPQSRNLELLKKFLGLVEKKYRQLHKVSDYARELSVTANYLNEVVKKVSGYPASHHIQQRIVLEAKRQGSYSEASMKEIAYFLGFEDIAHFSKFFKKASGSSFTEFKKALQSQPGAGKSAKR